MNKTVQFLVQHGGLVLFVVVFAKEVGLPLPAVPLLVAAGALAGTGQLSLWVVVGGSVVAAHRATGCGTCWDAGTVSAC